MDNWRERCQKRFFIRLLLIRFDKIAFLDSWHFIVSLNKYDDLHDKYRHECGGSIINKYQILSAAHCFKESKNPQDWIVIAGRNDFYIPRLHKPKGRYKVTENLKNVFIPKDIILHGGYRKVGKVNDIAIINLKQPLKLTEKPIGSIELALKPPSKSDKCMVAGWGSRSKNIQNSRSYPYKLHELRSVCSYS